MKNNNLSNNVMVCNKCGEGKPLEDFPFNNGYRRKRCRGCRVKAQREWRKKNPIKVKEAQRRHKLKKYGITDVEYQKIIKTQNNRCEVCGNEEKERPKMPIDHNHATGKFRGVICSRCNRVLGAVDDEATLLRKLAEYLERHNCKLAI